MSWSCCAHTIRSLTLEYLFEIRKQSAIEEGEEPGPESKARNMTVSDLTRGLDFTQDVIKVFEDIESTTCEQQHLDNELWGCFDVSHPRCICSIQNHKIRIKRSEHNCISKNRI